MVFEVMAPEMWLLIGIFASTGLELAVLWFAGRRWIAKRNAEVYNEAAQSGRLDGARDHFLAPLRAEFDGMKEEIQGQMEAFEGRFAEAYRTDMEMISKNLETQAESLKMWAKGQSGLEERYFRQMVEGAEGEVEEEINLMEAAASENPELVYAQVAKRLQRLGQDEKWQKEHPWGALIVEAGKPIALDWIRTMTYQMQGARAPAALGRGPGQGVKSPYGV